MFSIERINIETINPKSLIYKNNSDEIVDLPGFRFNDTFNGVGGIRIDGFTEFSGEDGSFHFNFNLMNVQPIDESPDANYKFNETYINVDPNGNQFEFGEVQYDYVQLLNESQGQYGRMVFSQRSVVVGNGSDLIQINGIRFSEFFGTIRGNAGIEDDIYGYSIGLTAEAGSSLNPDFTFICSFNDSNQINVSIGSYTSFNASPYISEVNNYYNGLNLTPSIDNIVSGGINLINLSPTLGTFANGTYCSIINVNPTVSLINYMAGIYVTMDNVTVFAGFQASAVIQDLTYTAAQVGNAGNLVSFEYVGGGTAGAEIVSGTFPTFQVQIEDGVSTADQIKAAIDSYGPLAAQLACTVSGTGTNVQTITAPVFLENGEDAGRKLAANFDGDVEISGSLQFGGALSIGRLNAFASQAIVNGGGQPQSVHSLISQVTAPDNATIALADTLGINTACLIDVGDNAVITTGFTGISALALPAVLEMGVGATIDRVAGATFAINVSGTGTGGTVDQMELCRSILIPNGITAINNLYGFKFDLPFGNNATNTWGVYITPEVPNFMAGALKIGGNNTLSNNSVALEIESFEKALVISRMDESQRDALDATAGMIIFNIDTNTFQGYDGTIWSDF